MGTWCRMSPMDQGSNQGRISYNKKYEPPNPRRLHTLMSTEDALAGKKSYWPELEITGTIRNLSPELWKLQHLTSLYLNDNNLSRIPPEICRLSYLTYLDLSSNKLRSLPFELGNMIMLRELLLNNNYLRVLPYELGKLFQLQNFGLKGNPLSAEILSIYSEPNGTVKLLTYMLDHLTVNAVQPTTRQWVVTENGERAHTSAVFTVMCYNVLCDKYATRQIYGYCPSWALNWEYRRKGIMEDIRQYAADIISLQEVETDQFYNFFLPELKRDGYDGIFSPKSRAKTMLESERKFVDGCAIFYRTSKFSLVKEHLVEFNQLAMANAEGSDDMLNRVMTKDNIGLAALLETKEAIFENGLPPDPAQARQLVLICTAHMHWDPEYCDVKLIQTMMLMSELKTIAEESQSFRPGSHTADPNTIPTLLCGDLNSLPDSGVVEFLRSGKVGITHADFKDLSYSTVLRKLSSTEKNLDDFTHSFKLERAYDNEIMPYTNYTYDFKGIIDYIFYSRQHFKQLGLLGPIDELWFRENKVVGCPNPHVPSDHFPLLVEFEMHPAQSPPNGLTRAVHR
ncbi:PREDICTED: CCR4-NOT transcription complex subunit 6-like isoform X2 [Priapulus caudatus]|uniref:poly(A)-specific ribonuclease n=1 Tax=Priapulus caudatus TaxID=37621 RepID=A0ABM1DNX1_PRICU|nr:PREDICTED: CCR4-NOT transcription complex subunit 6-like isoform X2 [Priapulus caudatus]